MLSDAKIRATSPSDRRIRLYDAEGLYLEVTTQGGRWWRLRYRFDGKAKLLSLGTYPETGLKEAWEKRAAARKLLAAGVDPSQARKAEKAARSEGAVDCFEAIAREWYATVHCPKVSDAHSARTLTRLTNDVFPWIGKLPIGDIGAPLILQTLRRVEARGAIETAHRNLQIIGQVFRYAVATGRAQRDASSDLRGALRPFLTRHMPAIPDPQRAGELLRAINGYVGSPVTRAALRLAPLVFVRPGELRCAKWSEFDLDEGVWRIEGSRMKRTKQGKMSGGDHVVPLSRQAIQIVQDLRPLTGHRDHVFPSVRGEGRPMSNGASSPRCVGSDSPAMRCPAMDSARWRGRCWRSASTSPMS